MSDLLINSGWDGMYATVQSCDDCEQPTIHLSADEGVAICAQCGYNPIFDEIADETDASDAPDNVIWFDGYC